MNTLTISRKSLLNARFQRVCRAVGSLFIFFVHNRKIEVYIVPSQKTGVIVAIFAYIIWGVFPIFWKQLTMVDSLEVLFSRIIWAFVFTTIYVIVIGQGKLLWQDLIGLAQNKGQLIRLFLASIFITVNWGVFIWAVKENHILQSSLGYYINPLLLVLFGVIFFKEKLERYTIVAIVIAAVGVLIMTISYGEVPWIALTLALTFGIYGVLKKKVTLDATRGLAIETMFITPFAIIGYIIIGQSTPLSFINDGTWISTLLILGGILTAIPLVLFATGAQAIPLYLIGFIQFIGPTISFCIGVFMYGEPFTKVELMAFSCIWTAVIIFSVCKTLEVRKAH